MGNIIYIPKPVSGVTPTNYGLLYNQRAIIDVRNLAATGWHVISRDNYFLILELINGGVLGTAVYNLEPGAYSLRETGTVHWNDSNGTDVYGFAARGSGSRNVGALGFQLLKSHFRLGATQAAYGQLISIINIQTASDRITFTGKNSFGLVPDSNGGYATRLVKDSSSLTEDGQTSTYTGNDGKVYESIMIAGIEVLKTNLAETKWRTGAEIYGTSDDFTDSEWTNLATAGTSALCAHSNDWSNV